MVLNLSRIGYLRAKVRAEHNVPHLTFVARLVLLAFVGPPPIGCQTCHNNGIKTDNRIDNLRWDTPLANHCDKFVHGTTKRIPVKSHRFLSDEAIEIVNCRFSEGVSKSKIARELNVSRDVIRKYLDSKSGMSLLERLEFNIRSLRDRVIELEIENRRLRNAIGV